MNQNERRIVQIRGKPEFQVVSDSDAQSSSIFGSEQEDLVSIPEAEDSKEEESKGRQHSSMVIVEERLQLEEEIRAA